MAFQEESPGNAAQTPGTDKPKTTKIITTLKKVTSKLIADLKSGVERSQLIKHQDRLTEMMHGFWEAVEKGTLLVDSKAMLRSMCCISCPEISLKLRAPQIDRAKIMRDISLLITTMEHVINPREYT